jgi:hypothetical protein
VRRLVRRLPRADTISSRTSSGSCSTCQARSTSADAPVASTAFSAYVDAPRQWSAMWAVATAWPAARAAADAALPATSRAAACAPSAAFCASPTETSPLAHAFAVSTARRGRSSELHSSKSDSTCSAQAAAQPARRRWPATSRGPPRWTAAKRRSRICGSPPPNGRRLTDEPSECSERPERLRGRRVRCNGMVAFTQTVAQRSVRSRRKVVPNINDAFP